MSWFDALLFCNWLSAREGRRACYERTGEREKIKNYDNSETEGYVWRCDFAADGYNLPTEAEWEYAARAESSGAFFYGDDEDLLPKYAWFAANAKRRMWPGGLKLPNALGLFDVHGNVAEWCWDWRGGYGAEAVSDPTGPASADREGTRMVRGGGNKDSETDCRCMRRSSYPPFPRSGPNGIRVCCSHSSKVGPTIESSGFVRRSTWPVLEQGGMQANTWSTSFSPDGRTYLAFGDSGRSGGVRLWDAANGKQLQELRSGRDVWFSNAAFLPNGEQVVTAYTNDKNVYLWDVATGKLVRDFQGHTADGVVAAVSHDGRLVSSGKDQSLRLWDVPSGREVWTQDVSGEEIAHVVFSPNDNLVLTSGADRALRIRELKTGAVWRSWKATRRPATEFFQLMASKCFRGRKMDRSGCGTAARPTPCNHSTAGPAPSGRRGTSTTVARY